MPATPRFPPSDSPRYWFVLEAGQKLTLTNSKDYFFNIPASAQGPGPYFEVTAKAPGAGDIHGFLDRNAIDVFTSGSIGPATFPTNCDIYLTGFDIASVVQVVFSITPAGKGDFLLKFMDRATALGGNPMQNPGSMYVTFAVQVH
jgi:hypothetical protein